MCPAAAKTAELTEALGHAFAQPTLLQDALTHPSLAGLKSRKKASSSAYERLEFLGDRVLGLVIAHWLYELYPQENEGDLAKRHAALVNRDALKLVAQAIKLDQHLRLAHGEEAGRARKNLTTLSDATEAIIGALYLDGGLDVAARFIKRYWDQTIRADAAPADPKTALQEWVQGQGLPLPTYKVVERSGPAHAPKFKIELTVSGVAPVVAEGESKRAAEKLAAQRMLSEIKDSK